MALATLERPFINVSILENDLSLTTSEAFRDLSLVNFICYLRKLIHSVFDKCLPVSGYLCLNIAGYAK